MMNDDQRKAANARLALIFTTIAGIMFLVMLVWASRIYPDMVHLPWNI